MAEQNTIDSAFPLPPSYYKFFTDENYKAFKLKKEKETKTQDEVKDDSKSEAIKEDQLEETDKETVNKIDNITGVKNTEKKKMSKEEVLEILFTSPKSPSNGEYQVFGSNYKLKDPLPKLGEVNIDQLYDDDKDLKTSLKELSKRVMTLYMKQLKVMAQPTNVNNPNELPDIIGELHTTFINMYHITNQYRPYQAIATLNKIYSERNKSLRDRKQDIQDLMKKAREELKVTLAEIDSEDDDDELKATSTKTEPSKEESTTKPVSDSGSITIQEGKDSVLLQHSSNEETTNLKSESTSIKPQVENNPISDSGSSKKRPRNELEGDACLEKIEAISSTFYFDDDPNVASILEEFL